MRNWIYLAGIVIAIAIASHVAFAPARAGTSLVFVAMGVPTVAFAIVAVVRAYRDGVVKDLVGVKGGDFTRGFASAAVLFGGAYAFSRVVTPPTSPQAIWLARLYDQIGDPNELRKSVGAVVVALVVMAVGEEVVWRGLVTSLLEEQVGSRRAWIWAAVLYAVAHVPTMWQLKGAAGMNPVIVIAALGCGLVWGGMARYFGRLLPGIFSHLLFDWTVLMMFRLWGPSL
ncbi:MAG: CPBP family intramembrane metalloprotease [Labilithrix sp.]|nr:CPBP family intramembrane metalloprotease [Labilithrix sp.]MCW5817103.1 CPBP family intramembrane metalloprotease [Labilithrix sp.]